jgi:chemotaxis protein MotB
MPTRKNKEYTLMRNIISCRKFSAMVVVLTGAMLFAGCVSNKTYNEVVAERDNLSQENQNLRRQTAAVQVVAVGLSVELELAEFEIAQMRLEEEELADEIAAWAVHGAIKMQLLADGLHILLPHDVLFASGSVQLKPEGQKLIAELVTEISQQPYQIAVLGFTDNVPVGPQLREQFPSNWEVAGARAASVVRLMQAEGIPAAQLVAVSQGENQPIASNATAEGRAQNRRIDVRIRPIVKQ